MLDNTIMEQNKYNNNDYDATAMSSNFGSSQQPTGWFQGLFRKRSSLGSEQQQQGRWNNNRRLQHRHSSMADHNNTATTKKEPQKINRSRSLDMAAGDMERRQRQEEDDEAHYQAIRRPSIPTSIHQKISALDKYLDDDYSSTRSNNFDYEDQSVVSEVTLMTYSDEKANLIKEEFFKRMKRQTKTLTLDEKKALLMEIQQDAEEIFLSRHAEAQQQKKLRTVMQKQRRISQESNICWQDKEEGEEEKDGNKDGDASIEGEQQQQNMQQRIQSSLERRKNSLAESISSVMTAKHCNVSEKHIGNSHINNKANDAWEATTAPVSSNNNNINFNKYYAPESENKSEGGVGGWGKKRDENEDCIREEEEEEVCEGVVDDAHDHPEQDDQVGTIPQKQAPPPSDDASASTRPSIDDIIELKLLVANQQATIDTLSSKLHNLEILSTRRFDEEQSKVTKLENENHTLTKRLGECQQQLNITQHRLANSITAKYTNYQRRSSTGTATTVGSKSSSDTSSSGAITL